MVEPSYPYDTRLVSELLKDKRRTRSIRSCFPCRHRKVRCSGQVPCTSCVKRSHAELCRMPTTVPSQAHDDQHPSLPATPQQSNSQAGMKSQSSEPFGSAAIIARLERIEQQISSLKEGLLPYTEAESFAGSPFSFTAASVPAASTTRSRRKSPGRQVIEDATGATIFLGSHSDFPSVLGCREPDMVWDNLVSDVMMERFVPRAYPFINLWGTRATARDICVTLPDDEDIIKYWQAYQSHAYPFYPVLVSIDEFSNSLFQFLQQRASQHYGGDDRIDVHEQSSPEPDSSWASLLFAVLACGVQFSDDPIQERELRTKVFLCSSFHCLRLSNFFSQTNADQIQAMALIGHCLRNNLDTNSAWILMGATIRLAQSIGLHEISAVLSPVEQYRRSRLWWILIWQDCFLSFTYDRPPSFALTKFCDIPLSMHGEGLSFQECIFRICQVVLDHTENDGSDQVLNAKEQFDKIREAAAPFLTSKIQCTCLQHHLERLAFQIHLGYAVCRMYRIHLDTCSVRNTAVIGDCKEVARQGIRAFLDLHRLSKTVCRSWAFVHNAVTCAITLHNLEYATGNDDRQAGTPLSDGSEKLLLQLISVLQREVQECEWRDTDTNLRHFGPFLRALKALQEIRQENSGPADDI